MQSLVGGVLTLPEIFPMPCNKHLSEQELQRIEVLEDLRNIGIEPYPASQYHLTHHSQDILNRFEENEIEEEWKEVSLAGRIMTKRIMGKASFIDLQDSKGRIQLYFNRDEICPGENKALYNHVFKKLLDIGDFIGVKGQVFKTRMSEITLRVKEFTILSKALRPLPIVKKDKEGNLYDAFSTPELRYRMRYVDLIVNNRVRNIFIKRTQIINIMRQFFNDKGYLEVETPILQSIPGGATARPFVTHHNSLDIPLYLRIANELYLKRLIVGGFEGVYEFAKDFRNEGMDRTHNPEFTVMEIYVAYKDYFWMMTFTESMIGQVVKTVNEENTTIKFNGKEIDFKPPFKRISMIDAVKEHTGFDISRKSETELREICQKLKVEISDAMNKGKLIDEIFDKRCKSYFIQPTFITDYPIEISTLCKKHRNNPELTERFELIVDGEEIANAYSELNDPIDQRKRFEEQLRLSEKGNEKTMLIDQDFLRALEYGMPPTSGMGIGIDRLTMILTDQSTIQEVLFFPQMRPEKKLTNI